MSVEELKIRKELEIDVEHDLEKEIKQGIYNLALKLHTLYQRQKERTLNSPGGDQNDKLLSEVNINIKMQGETIIQTKEIKKRARRIGNNILPSIQGPNHAQGVQGKAVPPRRIKFDWAKSLRSGSNPSDTYPRTHDKTRDKVAGNEGRSDVNASSNTRLGIVDRRIKTKLPDAEWKY